MNLPDMDMVDEQLTAYLDGELSPVESAQLERSLVDDDKLRMRLAELRQAYDLLDEIPETPHNQRFTKSTLELVIKDLASPAINKSSDQIILSAKASGKTSDWMKWSKSIALVVSLAAIGAVIALVATFVTARRELRDLGLIAAVRGLEDVNELLIAVKLSKETEAIAVLRDNLKDKLVPPPPDSVWQRKTWVQSLTPLQVSKLDSDRERMNKLDRDTRTRLAAIETQIEELPDHKSIQETVHVVGLVLDGMGSSKRNDMAVMKSDRRFEFLKELICMRAAVYYAARISEEEKAALEKWDLETFRPALILAVLPDRVMDTRSLLGRLFEQRVESLEDQEELIAKLTPNLSITAKKLLEGVSKTEQIKVVNLWLFPSYAAFSSTEALIDAYDKVEGEARDFRDRLDLADPQDIRRRLWLRGRRRP